MNRTTGSEIKVGDKLIVHGREVIVTEVCRARQSPHRVQVSVSYEGPGKFGLRTIGEDEVW